MGRTIRVMVLGIPNVGKSTFINKVAKRKTARAEDRPGVTRSKQWVPVDATLELLDTPGILWPKFDDTEVGKRLAFTGAIKDDVLDIEELACYLMDYLALHYADVLRERYKIDVEEGDSGYDLLEKAGRKRGFLMRGAQVDTERMARILLDEFRGGKLGRFTLETAEDCENERDAGAVDIRTAGGGPGLCGGMRRGRGRRRTADGAGVRGGGDPAGGLRPAGAERLQKLTEKKREKLFPLIQEQAVAWSVARVEASEIDETDILSARMKAMQLAIDGLSVTPDLALIDGNRDKGHSAAITTAHRCIVGGDGISASIAAASVLAKVSRDRYVTEILDKAYPQYQFARHKGYGTKLHYEMLDKYGPCPEHRRSFLKSGRQSDERGAVCAGKGRTGRGYMGRGTGGGLPAAAGIPAGGSQLPMPVRRDRPHRVGWGDPVLRGGQDPHQYGHGAAP